MKIAITVGIVVAMLGGSIWFIQSRFFQPDLSVVVKDDVLTDRKSSSARPDWLPEKLFEVNIRVPSLDRLSDPNVFKMRLIKSTEFAAKYQGKPLTFLSYQVHQIRKGWSSVRGAELAVGNVGTPISAFRTIGAPESIEYAVCTSGQWGPWIKAGDIAGSVSAETPVQGLRIRWPADARDGRHILLGSHTPQKGWANAVGSGDVVECGNRIDPLDGIRVGISTRLTEQEIRTVIPDWEGGVDIVPMAETVSLSDFQGCAEGIVMAALTAFSTEGAGLEAALDGAIVVCTFDTLNAINTDTAIGGQALGAWSLGNEGLGPPDEGMGPGF